MALARSQLALALGMPPDTIYEPQENLAEHSFPAITVADLEQQALAKRPDLKQVESERSSPGEEYLHGEGRVRPAAERLRLVGNRQPFSGMEWRQ